LPSQLCVWNNCISFRSFLCFYVVLQAYKSILGRYSHHLFWHFLILVLRGVSLGMSRSQLVWCAWAVPISCGAAFGLFVSCWHVDVFDFLYICIFFIIFALVLCVLLLFCVFNFNVFRLIKMLGNVFWATAGFIGGVYVAQNYDVPDVRKWAEIIKRKASEFEKRGGGILYIYKKTDHVSRQTHHKKHLIKKYIYKKIKCFVCRRGQKGLIFCELNFGIGFCFPPPFYTNNVWSALALPFIIALLHAL